MQHAGGRPVSRGSGLSRRTVLASGSAFFVASTAAGCGGGGDEPTASGRVTGPPATKPKELLVRTWGDPWKTAYADGPAKAFTQATGIPVRFDTTDYREMQAKVRQAVASNRRPPVDVINTIEELAFAASVQQLSTPLDPQLVKNFAALSPSGRPKSGSGYANAYSYSQPIVYAKAKANFPAGISWAELWKPEYRGRLFVTSTYSSLLFPTAKMLGLRPGTDDLKPAFDKIAELRPNIVAAGDEEEFIAGITGGEFDAGITLTGTALGNDKLAWVVPAEGSVVSFESLYVPRQLPANTAYYAQVFIDTVLEANVLTTLAAALGQVPTNQRSKPDQRFLSDPAAFPFSQADFDKYAIVVPPEVSLRNGDAWQAAYSAAISQ